MKHLKESLRKCSTMDKETFINSILESYWTVGIQHLLASSQRNCIRANPRYRHSSYELHQLSLLLYQAAENSTRANYTGLVYTWALQWLSYTDLLATDCSTQSIDTA